MDCDAVWSYRQASSFHRNIVRTASGLKLIGRGIGWVIWPVARKVCGSDTRGRTRLVKMNVALFMASPDGELKVKNLPPYSRVWLHYCLVRIQIEVYPEDGGSATFVTTYGTPRCHKPEDTI
jgi:hypothetical protein